MAKALPDPPGRDLEKANAGMKTKVAAAEEGEVALVDARKASLIRLALDVFFVVYLLFYVGLLAAMVIVSGNWWDPWPGVIFISPICLATLWLTPKMKDVYIKLYATKMTLESDSDLNTRLLASEKEATKL